MNKKVYLASPFEREEEREGVGKAKEILRGKGMEVYVPCEHKIPNAWDYSFSFPFFFLFFLSYFL